MGHEFRSAVRSLSRAPSSVAMVVLVLSIGVALATVVASVGYSTFARSLPYDEASRLLLVQVSDGHEESAGVHPDTFLTWQVGLNNVVTAAAYTRSTFTVRGHGEPSVVEAAVVTDTFFEVLRPPALMGRASVADPAVIVVSERLTQRLGWRVDEIIGALVTVAGRPFTVGGVVPASVSFPSNSVELWVSIRGTPAIELFRGQDARRLRILARLHEGVSEHEARERIRAAAYAVTQQEDQTTGPLITTIGVRESLVAQTRPALRLMTASAVILLIVACANAASTLLARAVRREREMAVRVALGSSRMRLVRLVIAESLVLAAMTSVSAAAVVAVVVWGTSSLLLAAVPGIQPLQYELRTLVMCIACAAAAALIAAASPAWYAVHLNLVQTLRTTSIITGRPVAEVWKRSLHVAQVAGAVVLVSHAGAVAAAVRGLLTVKTGVQEENVLTTTLQLTDAGGLSAEGRGRFIQQALDGLSRLPNVSAAGFGSSLPPSATVAQVQLSSVEHAVSRSTGMVSLAAATPGYFEALRIPLVSGRLFTHADTSAESPVAIITETVATRLYGGQDPVGRVLPARLPGRQAGPARVIGVVGDIRLEGLDGPLGGAIFVPWEHLPVAKLHLVVRADGQLGGVASEIKSVVREIDQGQPMSPVISLSDVVRGTVNDRTMQLAVIVMFALCALSLSTVGLVAAMSRRISERRAECAIRAAIGADERAIVWLLMRESVALLGGGVVTGAVLVPLSSAWIASMVGVGPVRYEAALPGAVLIVTIVVMSAAYVLARQAALVRPTEHLRNC